MSTTEQDGDVPDWDLADRMRKALRHAGVSTGEMAGYLGVSRQSVGNWISGRVDPSFQTVRLWSIRTGVPLEWVLGRTLVPAGRAVTTTSLQGTITSWSPAYAPGWELAA